MRLSTGLVPRQLPGGNHKSDMHVRTILLIRRLRVAPVLCRQSCASVKTDHRAMDCIDPGRALWLMTPNPGRVRELAPARFVASVHFGLPRIRSLLHSIARSWRWRGRRFDADTQGDVLLVRFEVYPPRRSLICSGGQRLFS